MFIAPILNCVESDIAFGYKLIKLIINLSGEKSAENFFQFTHRIIVIYKRHHSENALLCGIKYSSFHLVIIIDIHEDKYYFPYFQKNYIKRSNMKKPSQALICAIFGEGWKKVGEKIWRMGKKY